MAGTPTTHEVVSNTSPILYLHQIDRLDLLPLLFDRVVVPLAVVAELEAGRERGIRVPTLDGLDWIQIRSPDAELVSEIPDTLGRGEREVLALGLQSAERLVILDDKAGRRFALSRGIRLTGTLGLLVRGKDEGHVGRVLPLLDLLEHQGFRLHPRVKAAARALCAEE